MTSLEEGGVIQFTAHSDRTDRFSWSFGDGETMDHSLLAQHAYDEAGTFLATVVAKNEHCQNSASLAVKIAQSSEELNVKTLNDTPEAPHVQLQIMENTLALTSNINEACHISIFNMGGGLVQTASRSAEDIQNCQLNISQLATGMYYLHITTDDALLHAETFFRN
jgi:PKD repeat protein